MNSNYFESKYDFDNFFQQNEKILSEDEEASSSRFREPSESSSESPASASSSSSEGQLGSLPCPAASLPPATSLFPKIQSNMGNSFNYMDLCISGMNEFNDQDKNKYFFEEEFYSAYKKIFKNEKEEKNLASRKVFKNAESKTTVDISLEIEKVQKKYKNTLFKTIYPEKIFLFTPSENDSIEGFDINGVMSKKRIRAKQPRKRSDYDDEKRKSIKRAFFNKALLEALNKLLEKSNYFIKFPSKLVENVTREANKKIIYLSLKEIIENKKFYEGMNLNIYNHNMRALNLLKEKNNLKIDLILNMRFCDLFEEYLNSDTFKIDEINRLKKKNKSKDFIERYIYLSRHLIEFFKK